jgi:hypothetical protein
VTLIRVVFLRRVLQLLVTAKVLPSSLILFSLMMETISSAETSILTRSTQRNTEYVILDIFC